MSYRLLPFILKYLLLKLACLATTLQIEHNIARAHTACRANSPLYIIQCTLQW